MKKEVQLDANGKRKFGMRDCLAYAAGDLGCNMSFALKGTMATFWSQVMGLGWIYPTLLIIVQIWDAINDPLIGSIIDSDRRKYKRNKFLTYISIGSLGLIVGGALCFLPFPQAATWVKVIIFLAGYLIWDAFYTVANVPYGSLLSLISDQPADRASLSAWRSVGSMVGNMVPVILFPFLIYDNNKNIIGSRVFIIALVMGLLGFVCFQLMIRNTEVRIDTTAPLVEKKQKFNVWEAIKNFVKNRPAVGATLAAMGMFIGMQGASTAVTVVFQRYYADVTIAGVPALSLSGVISVFAMIPIVAFTPLARKMVTKYGKKELSIVGSIASIVGASLLFIIITNNKGFDLVMYIIAQLIYSLGLGIYSTVSWAMMGDAIDYNEWKTGKREEGTVYSLHSFFRKLAQGLGPALALVIMGWLGYVNNAILEDGVYRLPNPGETASAINVEWLSDETALKIRILVASLFLVSALFQFVGLALVYNLDKKTLAKMTAELEERHTAAATQQSEVETVAE